MCAERTTYSFFNAASLPGSLPTILADSTGVVFTLARALRETLSGKWGSGLRSLPNAAISSNLWPDAAKSFSACAGLKVIAILRPCVSLNSESASSMEGWARLSDMRDQGMSMEGGLGMLMPPITPACLGDFHRSPRVWEGAE